MIVPRGVFFEEARDRYRVRLYYRQVVIWRSYHPELDEAVKTLNTAKKFRLDFVRRQMYEPNRQPPDTIMDLL